MNYELICIISPKISDKEIGQEVEKIEKILIENKTENLKKNLWGKKELAYPIKKFNDGYYVQFNFELTSSLIKKVNDKLKLEGNIIRFLIISQKEEKQEDVKAETKTEKIVDKSKLEKIKLEPKKIEKKKSDNKKEFDKKLDEALEKELID